MLTIKTRDMVITKADNKIHSLVPTSTEVHIRFPDGVEVTIPYKGNSQTSAILQVISKSTAPNITVDFTSNNLVSFA